MESVHSSTTPQAAGDTYEKSSSSSRQFQDQSKQTTRTCIVYTEEDEATMRKLLRKIDWRIFPIAIVIYTFNFLDKVAFNVSKA